MKDQTQWRLVRARTRFIVFGGVLLSVSMLGLNGGWALTSDPGMRLQVDSGLLTAQLTQVTLRTVLDQLHDQLGIDYVAPDAELEKVFSVTLQKESLSRALSKILAPWNYAFTMDAAGKIQTLYVMAKGSPEASLPDTMAKNGGPDSHKQRISKLPRHGQTDDESGERPRKQLTKNVPMSGWLTRERAGASGKVFTSMAVPMEIRPPAPGTSMPIFPANRNDMPITLGGSPPGMVMIPTTAYAPMNIQPVPEHVQREMLLTLSP